MKWIKYIGFYSIIVIIFIYLFPVGKTVAIDAEPRVDIGTSAKNGRLFALENLKPGDWADRKITIENLGNRDFYYKMVAQFEDGSAKLYEALDLKVEYAGAALYEGKLSSFTGLDKRFLAIAEEEELSLSVEFPFEYGNDYQDLSTAVLFIFTAEAVPVRPPDTCEERGDCPEPPTTCEERGDCPEPPKTCEERGDCPEPPKTCEERGDCPEPPKTCEERGDCPEPPKTCKERGDCPEPPATCKEGNDCPEWPTCDENGECPELPEGDSPVEEPEDRDDSGIDESGKDSDTDSVLPGGKLPKTSTPWYNLLLLGLVGLIISGVVMWILRKREVQPVLDKNVSIDNKS